MSLHTAVAEGLINVSSDAVGVDVQELITMLLENAVRKGKRSAS